MRRCARAMPLAPITVLVAAAVVLAGWPVTALGRPRLLRPANLVLVALGDSVPAGTGCPSCATFVTLYAEGIAARAGTAVDVRNLAVPGQTSGQLAQALADDPQVAATVAAADVVTVTIGANDVDWDDYRPGACPALRCYAGALARLRADLRGVVARVRHLRRGRATAVRLTGYWDVWQDGAVARAHGSRYVTVGDAVTRQVNAVIAAVARETGTAYVDTRTPFRGPSGHGDDTALLAPDGDHPNQRGHALIADALLATGLSPLPEAASSHRPRPS